MPRKKDFWELADSTILGRTKKNELLQIARSEHQQVQSYRAQVEAQTQQIGSQTQLVDHLRSQLNREGDVHRQVLQDLLKTFEEQQQNHEQELYRLQREARDWENVAQNYEDVIITQRSEISYLQSITQRIKQFGQMSPFDAGQAFVKWLFGSKADEAIAHCPDCNGVIPSSDYRFCPHCGSDRQLSRSSQQA
ncbi:hypothetical protein H6F93_15505 [Leptolyngbya sp. FACHB-671]|uniref:zinc ribbon domain-containing protein n=1 Tax=Leptolyngbya sp. FACHB-671 TaxID=2692812 RepID=UPI001688F1CC|nr:zinc ribbon domain-containing protein [Leptolyngbya sp. FACHB-671]MBD2068910.1 hypothetical protein [Leptolyngbya sp. FACHB-671]